MKLEELNVYKLSMDIAEKIWVVVGEWDYFSKDTVGKEKVKNLNMIDRKLKIGRILRNQKGRNFQNK